MSFLVPKLVLCRYYGKRRQTQQDIQEVMRFQHELRDFLDIYKATVGVQNSDVGEFSERFVHWVNHGGALCY